MNPFPDSLGLVWHSGPIYTACVSSLASASAGHRLGMLTMVGWDLLAIPFLLWVDFDKGRREAGRTDGRASAQFVIPMSRTASADAAPRP